MKLTLLIGLTASILLAGSAQAESKNGASKPHSGLKPPQHGLKEVGCSHVHLEGGFWGPRLKIHHKVTIPHTLDKLEERHHLTNFDIAARVIKGGTSGRGTGRDDATDEATKALEGNAGNHDGHDKKGQKNSGDEIVGHSAFDSDVYKALEGACYTLKNANDPALRKRVDSMLDRILAAQEDDGYLVSFFTAKEPDQKWANMRLNHEMYNAGHFFEFAVAHHQLSGETRSLEAAKRFADHIDNTFGPGKRYEVGGHQGIELALIKLYRATGETRYLELCRFLLEERGHAHGSERKPFTEVIPRGDPKRLPGETMRDWRRKKWSMRNGRMQDHKPVLQQTEAVGHAVRAGYMYAAMADLARFSDAPAYAATLEKLWQDVVFRKMYLTGGVGTAQYGDEGYGDPYLLPNRTYCESCASIANVLWQHRMNLLESEAKYADVLELVLYNSALSGMSLSGDGYFYQNPLESKKGAERREWIGLACCPTNLARFTPQVGGLVYAQANKQLLVNLFAAGEGIVTMDDGKVVKITQETNYPWEGQVKLTVAPEQTSDFALLLRIPAWALGKPLPGDLYRFADTLPTEPVMLKINGKPVAVTPGKDGYVHLKRSWKPGDLVELDLPMPVRRVYAHEKIEGNRGKVALMRGPVVYCFEGVDNQDINLFKMTLPKDAQLTASYEAKLLHGVSVIHGQGLDENQKPVKLTAIPYFAWANRGKTPMNLWIHESQK
ncbi:MAG: glycoside hydrolase family 127 protein [Akkermansiaceae bacterium]|nr:glycoside hydrolase family 127 protein [Akkermansiaceae bacterium]